MMDWSNNSWGAGDWVAMTVAMGLFWGAIVALVVWTIRGSRLDRTRTEGQASPDDLLAARFARGEIDGEQFARHRDLLHGTAGSPPR